MVKLPPSIFALLALRQQKLNRAVGIRRVTPLVAALVDLYQQARQEEQRDTLSGVLNKAFYLGVIREARRRIKEITQYVNEDTPLAEAQRLHREAMLLQAQIEQAIRAING